MLSQHYIEITQKAQLGALMCDVTILSLTIIKSPKNAPERQTGHILVNQTVTISPYYRKYRVTKFTMRDGVRWVRLSDAVLSGIIWRRAEACQRVDMSALKAKAA